MKMLKYSIYKLKQVSKSGAHFLIQDREKSSLTINVLHPMSEIANQVNTQIKEHLAPNIQAYFASGHNGNWYGKYTVMQKIYVLKFCYKE